MKLSSLNMHLTKQNKLNMKSPPISEREFASLIHENSRIINKVSYFYATDKVPFEDMRQEIYVNMDLQSSGKLGSYDLAFIKTENRDCFVRLRIT